MKAKAGIRTISSSKRKVADVAAMAVKIAQMVGFLREKDQPHSAGFALSASKTHAESTDFGRQPCAERHNPTHGVKQEI